MHITSPWVQLASWIEDVLLCCSLEFFFEVFYVVSERVGRWVCAHTHNMFEGESRTSFLTLLARDVCSSTQWFIESYRHKNAENNESVKLTTKKVSLLFVVHCSFSFRLIMAVPLSTLPEDVNLWTLKGRKMCGPSVPSCMCVLSLPVVSVEIVIINAYFFSYFMASSCALAVMFLINLG